MSERPTGAPTAQTELVAAQASDNSSTALPPVNAKAPPTKQAPEGKDAGKPSAADLKKQKKAEKQARRAQAKDATAPAAGIVAQGPPAIGTKQEGANEAPRHPKGGATTGSSAASKRSEQGQKALPIRAGKEVSDKPAVKTRKDDKNVALFGHLYSQPRCTTLAQANKDVHPAVLALGLKLSSYSICGSTARCVAMLLCFKRLIESYTTPPGHALSRHLVSQLSPQIEYLVACRPLAISMGNAIRWLKTEIAGVELDAEESRVKADLCDAIDVFIRERISAAGQVIANTAQEKIQDGDVILTFAKSHVVQQTLVQALRNGRKFKVIVLDSRPLHEGKNLAVSLAEIGLDVTYSSVHAASHLIDRSTKVFLGAHSMLGNGRLYSRAGSAMLAMLAHEAAIPVIVCCESIKFTDRTALDSIVTNEVAPPEELLLHGASSTSLDRWRDSPNLQLLNLMYDVTPAEFISEVITEHGSLPSSSVPVVHRLSTNT